MADLNERSDILIILLMCVESEKPVFAQCKSVFLGSMQHYRQVRLIRVWKNVLFLFFIGKKISPVNRDTPLPTDASKNFHWVGHSLRSCVTLPCYMTSPSLISSLWSYPTVNAY